MTSTPHSRLPQSLSPDAAEALAREAEMGYDTDSGDSIGKQLLSTTDAAVWARLFKQQFGDVAPDEATMLTWFANAIGVGESAGRKQLCPHTNVSHLADDLSACMDCGTLFQPVTLEESFVEGFQEGR